MKFSVTYERYLPHDEDEEICDADARGFVVRDVTLREAVEAFNDAPNDISAIEPNEYPMRSPRWITAHGSMDYLSGIAESRSLHFPRGISDASACRIARLLGCR